ncbi:DUF1254 domain-containing protein [Roseococcus sp. SDR]|uniref:DUF1254 domain-containing protein n=1 Tax=Roseococcus sp. SDR TaxID=2835532 RepID=UPI001BCF80A9|nr:DUF1254 domain-containing protein [Roseococcus sp. SDR]MBS7788441.1 DUF1254 domain-containing protein [Roseococcus sp. SDR]MBV1843755.1 DUF1254 domain-containing protein [Roseococcus sp. SDR]
MITKRTLFGATAAAGLLARPALVSAQGRPGIIGSFEAAEQAFIFGLPLVMNYTVMYEFAINRNSGQFKAPFNTMWNDAQVFTWRDTAIPTPNSDTPYSMSWLDLRAEPVVISVPDVPAGRYFSVQVCDGNTYNVGYIGSRTTGQGAGSWMVVGPGWQGTMPAGIKGVIRSTTQFALTIFRTQLFGVSDMPNVVAVQRGYRTEPLSTFTRTAAPPPAPDIRWPRANADLAKHHFFDFLAFALQFSAPQANEAAIRAQMATIGIDGRGTALPHSFFDRMELLGAAFAGERKVEAAVAAAGVKMNGWNVTAVPGSPEAYNGNWMLRAVAAKAGIYANSTEEATYPFTRTTATGETLDGSKGRYTLTFGPNQLPPVNAFWSVTMYHGGNQLLVQNPIDRYLINSPMLQGMRRNPDGGVTLHIQKDDPGEALRANWLPAPDGPIYMVMRLYWPKTEAPSLLPIGQGAWQPPGIVKVG